MSIQAVGSSIQITYKTKAPTFTPEQLMRALKEKQYVAMQGQATDNRNRAASPIIIPAFSKENVNIFYYPNETLFVVQILNTIDLTNVLKDLKPILIHLNMTENVMANITFNCRTSVISSENEPLKNLTSLVDSKFLDGINSMMNDNLKVGAIRLISGVEPSDDYTIN